MPELTISIDNGKTELIAEISKSIANKTVQDFVVGKTQTCTDAKCTYDANDGWITLPDKSIHHEVDAVIAQKYDICKDLRPDLVKPYGDSFYYHTDGTKKKLLTRKEMLAVIDDQDWSKADGL